MAGILSDIAIRWRLRSLSSPGTETPPAWEKIKRIALVIASAPSVNKHELDAFVEKLGKYVEVFFVEPRAIKPTFSDWRCLTRRDFGVLSMPRQKVMAELRKKEFDLVINAAPPQDGKAVLVAAAIPARLHCSSSHRYHEARLVITQENSKNLVGYLAEVIRYLQMIRPGKG